MTEVPYRKIEGEEFQHLAEGAHVTTLRLLNGMHQALGSNARSSDGGPVITGALSAVVEFIIMAGHGEAECRDAFENVLNAMPQQFLIERAAREAGAMPGGPVQ